MAKILILGAKGNLGPAIAQANLGNEIVSWDREELDITDKDAVLEKIKTVRPDIVYNCAAYNAVDKAETETDRANLINGIAVGYIAEACNQVDAILIHFSTNYVFTGNSGTGYDENAIPDAESKYGQSKILGEEQAKTAKRHYIIRTSLLYGKTINGKKSFNDIALELSQKGEEVKLVNDEIGHPTYVKDLAEAVKDLVQTAPPSGIYHLTNGGYASWYDWGKEIYAIKEITVPVTAISSSAFPRPAPRPKFGVLLNTKTRQLRPWQDALREYFNS